MANEETVAQLAGTIAALLKGQPLAVCLDASAQVLLGIMEQARGKTAASKLEIVIRETCQNG